MSKGGFFTRQDFRDRAKKSRQTGVSIDTMRKLGLQGVKNMNPEALSPNMEPDVPDDCQLLVLGEAPNRASDEENLPFASYGGQYIRDLVPAWVKPGYDNIVRTYPGNRQPKPVEIECFRKSVTKTIERSKPRVIIAVGTPVLRWFFPNVKMMVNSSRGRRFPVKVGKHVCWMFPILQPSYALRLEADNKKLLECPGSEWVRYLQQDITSAVECSEDGPKPRVQDARKVFVGVDVMKPATHSMKQVIEALREFDAEDTAWDLETNMLRPYGKGARILSIAVSDGTRTLAFPIDHPDFPWKQSIEPLKKALHSYFLKELARAAHNLSFDLEWMVWFLGKNLAHEVEWDCTMQQAYILDERKGALSLDYLCALHFGMELKSLTESGHWKNRLREMPIDDLLKYNALDAKYTARLMKRQRRTLKEEGLTDVYNQHMERIPALVLAQAMGIPASLPVTKQILAELKEKVAGIVEDIRAIPDVQRFEAQGNPRYNPASVDQTVKLFRDHIGADHGRLPNGKYTTNAAVLEQMGTPLAKLLLQFRNVEKLRGTYVETMIPGREDSIVWPDGLIHCSFKPSHTGTGRLSSAGPNNQNWPKRKDKYVRRQIKVKRDEVIISVDQGQIEARVLAMASRDKSFCEALWNDYDIHMEWAEHCAKVHPPALRAAGNIKKFRGLIKNQLVFPAFFGAHQYSIAKYTGIPDRKIDRVFDPFWETFKGVKKWQRRLHKQYEERGYTECLTGRRRRGPLSWNQVLNSPIQGTASDIVVYSMGELSIEAYESDRPWLQPALNIHDDLTFIAPKRKQDEAIEVIVKQMLTMPPEWQDWLNVPLSVEVEVGNNWFEMQEVGTYRSDRI